MPSPSLSSLSLSLLLFLSFFSSLSSSSSSSFPVGVTSDLLDEALLPSLHSHSPPLSSSLSVNEKDTQTRENVTVSVTEEREKEEEEQENADLEVENREEEDSKTDISARKESSHTKKFAKQKEVDEKSSELLRLWAKKEQRALSEEKLLTDNILQNERHLREKEREREKENEAKRIRVTEQLRQQRMDEQADEEELKSRSLSSRRHEKWRPNHHSIYGNPHRHEYDEKDQSEIRTLEKIVSENDRLKTLQSLAEFDVTRDEKGIESQSEVDKRSVTSSSGAFSNSGRFLSPPSVLISVSNVPINSNGAAQCHTQVLFSFVTQIYVPTYLTNSGNVTLIDTVPTGSTLNVGSVVTSLGRVIEGNNPGDVGVTVFLGELPIGTSFVKVTFLVTLNGNFDGIGILYGNIAKVSIGFWGDTTLTGNDVVFYSCDEPPPFHVPFNDEMDGGEIAATVVLSVFGFFLLVLLLAFLARGKLGSEEGSYFSSNDAVTPAEESDPRYAEGRTNLAGPNVSDSVKREYVDTTLHTEKEVDLGIEAEVRASRSRPGLGGALAVESSSMRDYRGGVNAK